MVSNISTYGRNVLSIHSNLSMNLRFETDTVYLGTVAKILNLASRYCCVNLRDVTPGYYHDIQYLLGTHACTVGVRPT